MPLGTRLDRPSAVGDEGRARETSLTVVAVVVVALLTVTGFLVGQPLRFLSYALLVGVATTGLALLQRDRFGAVLLGHLLFLPAGVALAGLVAFSGVATLLVPGFLFLVAGALAAMFGVTSGWNDAFDRATVRTALVGSGLSYGVWLVGLVVVGILVAIGSVGRAVVVGLTAGTGPVAALLGLLALAGVASACLYLAVRAVPAIQLTPVHRRPAARARYTHIRRALGYTAVGAFGLLSVSVVGLLLGALGVVLAVAPLSALLVLAARVFAVPLAFLTVFSVLVAVAAWALRRLATGFEGLSTRTVAAAVAGGCYLVVFLLLIGVAMLRLGVFAVPLLVVAPVALLVPLALYALLLVTLVALYAGVVPNRAGSSALTAAGLVSMGLGGALYGFPSLYVFAAVTGGLVAWDVGTFGLGVTAELGHIPRTRRLELYHGLVAVGIGLLAVAGLTVVDLSRRSVGVAVGTPVATAIAVLGVLLVAVALRG
ncbi:glycosyl transferase [Haloarcula onubensis]|uniref:Glycosyl transferase n=1 Tax=Haloarcula onubensis TaxID=2950539 RepID=A0ABU2FR15_9EURY|nr:glycosyl transferase [Halomicroarcula sp. S3CR25-11]MDS0283208.1 glycosyl transferase [Halomicroarcula sp. S3CR25-11]